MNPGEILAEKYRLVRLLGAGGMGNVYEARHVELNTRVAVKVLHPELLHTTDAPKRFAQEARAAAGLKSIHAVRILDIDRTAEGLPFIVMEYLEGEDVGSLLADGPLPIHRAVGFIIQACDAIGEAHERGIIHRDIKPRNLWLAPAEVIKVLDFGLAKRLPDDTKEPSADTSAHTLAGAPHYMSPEQVRSAADVDERTDIWSLGATLYQLVTGFPPFMGNNLFVLCARILDGEPEPLARRRPDAPESFDDLVRCCLQKDPANRFRTIDELVIALTEVRVDLAKPTRGARPARSSKAPTRPVGPRPPPVPPPLDETLDLPTEKRVADACATTLSSANDDTIKMTEAEAAAAGLDELAVTTKKRGP
jgi:serine/threonine protein kinase